MSSYSRTTPGFSAYTDFSPQTSQIALSNLYDGFSVYDLTPFENEFTVIRRENANNIPLPVCFIHGGQDLLLGSPTGDVCITSGKYEPGVTRSFYYLRHNGEFLQLHQIAKLIEDMFKLSTPCTESC